MYIFINPNDKKTWHVKKVFLFAILLRGLGFNFYVWLHQNKVRICWSRDTFKNVIYFSQRLKKELKCASKSYYFLSKIVKPWYLDIGIIFFQNSPGSNDKGRSLYWKRSWLCSRRSTNCIQRRICFYRLQAILFKTLWFEEA